MAVFGDVVIASQIAGGTGRHTILATVFGILFILLLTPVCLRAGWTGIFASKNQIHVRNIFGSMDIAWTEIERFDIGQSGIFPQVCRIHTKDGRVLRAFGIQEYNISLVRPKTKRPAQKVVAELNAELAERTAEPHAAQAW
jgi:hypothetical protein